MAAKWAIIFLGFIFSCPSSSTDVCNGPFTQFLQCMAKDADARIENYSKEVSPESVAKVQQCFTQAGCPPPDFSKAQVGFFVQEPWTGRLNAFMTVMDTMDPKVQRCMTKYFKETTAKKINDCVKRHGPKDIKDFEMPPIPGGENVNMSKMKTVFLNRMMVDYQMGQCPALTGNPQAHANLLSCVKGARQEIDNGGMCKARESCVQSNIKNGTCSDRFTKIQKTACECFNSEKGRQDVEKTFKNTLLNGNVEKKFKECHQQNGVPYPKEKVDAAKQAAKAGFAEVFQNQGRIPPGVQGAAAMGKQVMDEMSEQWKDAFCAECGAGNGANAAALQQTATAIQPQLPPSPLINQFQSPNQFQPAMFPAAPAAGPVAPNFGGAASPNFVVPPPLPPQATGVQAAPIPAAPQQSSVMSFEDFKQKLAATFGSAG